jgi:hypothetical protein
MKRRTFVGGGVLAGASVLSGCSGVFSSSNDERFTARIVEGIPDDLPGTLSAAVVEQESDDSPPMLEVTLHNDDTPTTFLFEPPGPFPLNTLSHTDGESQLRLYRPDSPERTDGCWTGRRDVVKGAGDTKVEERLDANDRQSVRDAIWNDPTNGSCYPPGEYRGMVEGGVRSDNRTVETFSYEIAVSVASEQG